LKIGPPFYDFSGLDDLNLPRDEHSEWYKFLLNLKIWESTPGHKPLLPSYYWNMVVKEGPACYDYIKDIFEYSLRYSIGYKYRVPEGKEVYHMESYNSIYPYVHLPFFREEDPRDYEYSLTESESDPDTLEDFRFVLRKMLEDIPKVEKLEDDEILTELSTTTSYNPFTHTTAPHWTVYEGDEKFATEIRAKRCLVPVTPCGMRDTIICSKASNNTIRWCERQLRAVLEYFPESAVCDRSSQLLKRKRDVIYTEGIHVLRDFKKCGLTNNPELMRICQEELSRWDPSIPFERLDIYQHIYVRGIDQDELTYTKYKRGYGLGMANHLMTLVAIVIHRLTLYTLKHFFKDKKFMLKCIIGNDDSDVVFTGSDKDIVSEIYMNQEADIIQALGNMYNMKKSFRSKIGLFYAEYSHDDWNTKDSLLVNTLSVAYLAKDIRHAKMIIATQSDRFCTKWSREQLYALYTFWGNEFFEFREYLLHFECGGWLDYRKNGLKTTFDDIFNLVQLYGEYHVAKALNVTLNTMDPINPKLKAVGEPSFSYLGSKLELRERKTEYNDLQHLLLSEESYKSYMKSITSAKRNKFRVEAILKYAYRKRKIKPISFYINNLLGKGFYLIPPQMVKTSTYGVFYEECREERRDIFRLNKTTKRLILSEIVDISLFPKGLTFSGNELDHYIGDIFIDSNDHVISPDKNTDKRVYWFSNTGQLPLNEYYKKYQQVPVELVDWVKPFENPINIIEDYIKVVNIYHLSRFKGKFKEDVWEEEDYDTKDSSEEEYFESDEDEVVSGWNDSEEEESSEPEKTLDELVIQAVLKYGLCNEHIDNYKYYSDRKSCRICEGYFTVGYWYEPDIPRVLIHQDPKISEQEFDIMGNEDDIYARDHFSIDEDASIESAGESMGFFGADSSEDESSD
jgi:hypothetical protein